MVKNTFLARASTRASTRIKNTPFFLIIFVSQISIAVIFLAGGDMQVNNC